MKKTIDAKPHICGRCGEFMVPILSTEVCPSCELGLREDESMTQGAERVVRYIAERWTEEKA